MHRWNTSVPVSATPFVAIRQIVFWVLASSLLGGFSSARAADLTPKEILPPNSLAVLEVRQPGAVYQHVLVRQALSILEKSRAFQDTISNPDYDLLRDSINHFESEFGLPILQILDGCAGDGVWISAGPNAPNELCVIVSGRDPALVAKLPNIALKLIRKIVASSGVSFGDPPPKTYQQHDYYQLGEAFYSVVGGKLLLANRETTLQGLFDRLDGRQPATTIGLTALLSNPTSDGTDVRLAVDLKRIQQLPGFPPQFTWPPKEIAPVILAGGWMDLLHRSPHALAEIDLGHDALKVSVRFPADYSSVTKGTVGYFASEAQSAAAPLLEPARTIYSASWYRDYGLMWEKRNDVPLPDQVKNLETQLAKTMDGNLGYSAFDIIRLIGPHIRVVATRPGTSPYRVTVTDRLPNFALVWDLKDEKEFRDKVLPPIQKILGIVALTNKMIAQNVQYKSAEVSGMKFSEDAASISGSDRVRYNFEPAYSVTRGHLIVGSTAGIVRNLIDELDRLNIAQVQASPAPGPTERQILRFEEFAGIIDDLHGLSVRNAVLNDGMTIGDAEHELGVFQQLIAALGQLKVEAGFDSEGFEYRVQLQPSHQHQK